MVSLTYESLLEKWHGDWQMICERPRVPTLNTASKLNERRWSSSQRSLSMSELQRPRGNHTNPSFGPLLAKNVDKRCRCCACSSGRRVSLQAYTIQHNNSSNKRSMIHEKPPGFCCGARVIRALASPDRDRNASVSFENSTWVPNTM
jgi:hypothetical protein